MPVQYISVYILSVWCYGLPAEGLCSLVAYILFSFTYCCVLLATHATNHPLQGSAFSCEMSVNLVIVAQECCL